MQLVCLLEEPSAARFLREFLPRWRPGLDFLCIPHQGKSDLERSVPRKLRAWQNPSARFVVMRDNDGSDCTVLKARLQGLCKSAGKPETLVRIACQELEAWYLGDLAAVGDTFGRPDLGALQAKRKYREPDGLSSPSVELKLLVPQYQKLQGSAQLGQQLPLETERNRSHSFRVFFEGLETLLREAS